METVKTLDVRVIEPRLKHPSIFNAFDELNEEESFVIVNDHDPKPLYYQFLAERPQIFTWKYMEEGPAVWMVEIGKTAKPEKEATLGQLAAKDYRKALVFKKFGIDFCCGGKKTIEEAAKEKGIDKSVIEAELAAVDLKPATEDDFNKWPLPVLIDHIVDKHHGYLQENIPHLHEILHKVVMVHSEGHPELIELHRVFSVLQMELFDHLRKEEDMLFPFIKAMHETSEKGDKSGSEEGIKHPIRLMEDEHTAVAELISEIKLITSGYTLPSGACNSYRMLFGMLRDLEEDLIQHIHLENNVLFPKAIELEKKLFS